MRFALAGCAAAAALLCAGCGGGSGHRPRPTLPRSLAAVWSREARAIAAALDAGDACTAERESVQLRTEVVAAVNARRIPAALLEPLTSAVNSLPERIVCLPAPAAHAKPPKGPKPPKPDHGHGHGHGHGHDNGEGD